MKCCRCEQNSEYVIAKITDKNGFAEYCQNCLCELFFENKLLFENNPDFIDDITGEKGAVKYEAYDETYVLEKSTMIRLIARNLEPEEYFALVKKYGANKFLLHDDFYDPFDGIAVQPSIR